MAHYQDANSICHTVAALYGLSKESIFNGFRLRPKHYNKINSRSFFVAGDGVCEQLNIKSIYLKGNIKSVYALCDSVTFESS